MTRERLCLCPHIALRVYSDGVYLVNSLNGSIYHLSDELGEKIKELVNMKQVTPLKSQDIISLLDDEQIKYLISEGILCTSSSTDCGKIHVSVSPYPRLDSVLFEISSMCNLRCKHCYNVLYLRNSQILSKSDIYSIIDKLDRLGVRRIQISGGEPLLRNDLVEILRYIKEKRIFIDVIVTNGTLINEKVLGAMRGLVDTFFISLDGFELEHDEFRGVKGAWKMTVKGIRMAQKHGYRVILNTMVHKKNYRYMEKFYTFAKEELRVNGIRFGMPKLAGRFKQNYEEFWIDPETYVETMAKILERYLKEKDFAFRLEIGDMFRWSILSLGILEHDLNSHTCSYNTRNMHIRPDGAITFCPSLGEYVYGNILTEGEAVYGKLLSKIESEPYFRIKNLPKCRRCIYYKICGGGCRANAIMFKGSPYAEDPISCLAMRKIHEMIELFPKSFKDQFLGLIEKAKREIENA